MGERSELEKEFERVTGLNSKYKKAAFKKWRSNKFNELIQEGLKALEMQRSENFKELKQQGLKGLEDQEEQYSESRQK